MQNTVNLRKAHDGDKKGIASIIESLRLDMPGEIVDIKNGKVTITKAGRIPRAQISYVCGESVKSVVGCGRCQAMRRL